MNKYLFTSDKELMADQRKDTTKVHLDEPEDYLFQAVQLWASSRQFQTAWLGLASSNQFSWSQSVF